jgi:hypothetical protein
MSFRIFLGISILFPLLVIRKAKLRVIMPIIENFFAFIIITIPVDVFFFFLLFFYFYLIQKPLIFPEGHPLAPSRIRTIGHATRSHAFQTGEGGQMVPNPAIQLRLHVLKQELGKGAFCFFPCPLIFPKEAKFFMKLLNALDISMPEDVKDGEIIRYRGLFKTRNSLRQNVAGDIYIEVKATGISYYLVFLAYIVLFFLSGFIGIQVGIMLGIWPF